MKWFLSRKCIPEQKCYETAATLGDSASCLLLFSPLLQGKGTLFRRNGEALYLKGLSFGGRGEALLGRAPSQYHTYSSCREGR